MSTARRPLIAGNWKMNGLGRDGTALAAEVAGLLKGQAQATFDLLVCPPFTLISKVADALKGSGVALGGQNCHQDVSGAHTGDISAAMLQDLGCTFVIVGHSERRADHRESDSLVRIKAEAAHAAGLTAIICIGETEEERDKGKTFEVVKTQLAGSVPDAATAANTVIAYEPVWAIGTGRTPSAAEVQEVHALIRSELARGMAADEAQKCRVLYGGSVKPDNAPELMALPDVDGGLIGGASLKAADFWAIAQSCR
ncbi:MAG: triose-phosphate isomerase [Rhodospirillales bacterium]